VEREPEDQRDALETLIQIYELHLAPLDRLCGMEWFQHDPSIGALKQKLELRFVELLSPRGDRHREAMDGRGGGDTGESGAFDDPSAALRAIATCDRIPPVYDWVAEHASLPELVEFMAIEGGPDGGFDDLVAICQVGIGDLPKLAFGANYWDEMGRGDPALVHTEVHRRLSRALDLPILPPHELPTEALERTALNGLLATNRALQPELIGALGLLELQAGPRCRRVVTALRRLDAPADALPFYEEHAVADPLHGKDWLDRGVGPLVERFPAWGPRIVRGAQWRSDVNGRLFAALYERFVVESVARAA
jgi:hypothetical protein